MAIPLEVQQVWNVLIRTYPYYAKESTPDDLADTLTLYQELLADVPGEILKAAAKQYLVSSRFFPTPSELRQPAMALSLPARETAMEAWGTVMDAISSSQFYFFVGGPVKAPTFANPITARVVECMGGYFELGRSENQIADRARFIEAYEQLSQRELAEVIMLPEVRKLRAKLLSDRIISPLVKQLSGGNGTGPIPEGA